jgi:hypothetical protein
VDFAGRIYKEVCKNAPFPVNRTSCEAKRNADYGAFSAGSLDLRLPIFRSALSTSFTRIPESATRVIFSSCAVLCAPLSYLMVELKPNHILGMGGQIKMIFLLAILWTVLKHPMPSSIFGDLPALGEDQAAALS